MPISRFSAGMLLPIKAESVMVGGVLRKLKTVKVMRGDALVTVATYAGSALSASASPSSVSGARTNNRVTRVVSDAATVAIDGGAGPYTYAWTVSPIDQVVIDAPASATTTFSQTMFDVTLNATARCTISDSFGRTATCDVAVSLSHYYAGGTTPENPF